jgi:glycosyltransferase involved in cell wall biosynthesis
VSPRRVLYLAAHGGFSGQSVPLGGGAAVANLLEKEWAHAPFELQMVTPAILGAGAPTAKEIVGFSERQYAAFCRDFSRAATAEALKHDPASTAVLVNDISEGPDFAALNAAKMRVVTIYHVDVVAYIAQIYLSGHVRPASLTRLWERLGWLPAPNILRLIFAQQRASLAYSSAVVVPSRGMKTTLLECYPATPAERIHVVGWGAPPVTEEATDEDVAALRNEFSIEADERVLLTLSRISPEKGQDTLLEALLGGACRGHKTRLFICGEAAFMMGETHLRKLKALVARLKHVKVEFPGHVMGRRKQAFFRLADLYVFPSRHESYGLTLMEALRAGCAVVAIEQQGSRDIVRPEFGRLARSRAELGAAIDELLADPEQLSRMRLEARKWAETQTFSAAAAKLSALLGA